jgi:hypothetical protein
LMDKGKIEAWLMTKFNWILNNHRLDYRGPIVHTLWEDKSICLMSSSVITVLLIHVSHFFRGRGCLCPRPYVGLSGAAHYVRARVGVLLSREMHQPACRFSVTRLH